MRSINYNVTIFLSCSFFLDSSSIVLSTVTKNLDYINWVCQLRPQTTTTTGLYTSQETGGVLLDIAGMINNVINGTNGTKIEVRNLLHRKE